jgi:hypothetical protein
MPLKNERSELKIVGRIGIFQGIENNYEGKNNKKEETYAKGVKYIKSAQRRHGIKK